MRSALFPEDHDFIRHIFPPLISLLMFKYDIIIYNIILGMKK